MYPDFATLPTSRPSWYRTMVLPSYVAAAWIHVLDERVPPLPKRVLVLPFVLSRKRSLGPLIVLNIQVWSCLRGARRLRDDPSVQRLEVVRVDPGHYRDLAARDVDPSEIHIAGRAVGLSALPK